MPSTLIRATAVTLAASTHLHTPPIATHNLAVHTPCIQSLIHTPHSPPIQGTLSSLNPELKTTATDEYPYRVTTHTVLLTGGIIGTPSHHPEYPTAFDTACQSHTTT